MISKFIRPNRLHLAHSLRMKVATFALLVFAAMLTGCALNQSDGTASSGDTNDEFDIVYANYLSREKTADELRNEAEYAQQIRQDLWDEVLRLGPPGEALIALNPASLTARQALVAFYDEVGSDAAQEHHAIAQSIESNMFSQGDGSKRRPFAVLNLSDALTYSSIHNEEAIGYRYDYSETYPLLLEVLIKHIDAPLERRYYEILAYPVYLAVIANRATVEDISRLRRYERVLRLLLRNGDSAAGVSIASLAMDESDADKGRTVVNRLTAARYFLDRSINPNNAYSYGILGDLQKTMASWTVSPEEQNIHYNAAADSYRTAAAAAYNRATFELAMLNLYNRVNGSTTSRGLNLLEDAIEAYSADAATALGSIYFHGSFDVTPDLQKADALMRKGVEWGSLKHRIAYIEYLTQLDSFSHIPSEELDWLESQANNQESDAMYLLAQLNARGFLETHDLKRALYWYKQAATASTENIGRINDIAWTLTTTPRDELRDVDFAFKVMNEMMLTSSVARREPAYLDTWAATFAARGEFDKAISIQIEAVEIFRSLNHQDGLRQTLEHLQAFLRGETVIDSSLP